MKNTRQLLDAKTERVVTDAISQSKSFSTPMRLKNFVENSVSYETVDDFIGAVKTLHRATHSSLLFWFAILKIIVDVFIFSGTCVVLWGIFRDLDRKHQLQDTIVFISIAAITFLLWLTVSWMCKSAIDYSIDRIACCGETEFESDSVHRLFRWTRWNDRNG